MPTLKVKIDGEWQQVLGGSNGNGSIELDPTLSYPGMAADAFAVGEKIGDISTLVTEDKRSLTNAINELASSNKSAFIVTFDLDLMRASHNSTQIIEAAKAGSVVIGQVLAGDLGTFNCYLNTAIPFADSDDRVEFITLQKNSNQIMSITVSKDYSIQDHAEYFSTIDKITDATVGQIPVLTHVDSDGSPIGWTTVDLPEGIAVDETLTVAGAAADAKIVGDQIGSLESLNTEEKTNLVAAINEVANKEVGSSVYVQDEEPENAVVGSLWLDTDEENGSGTGGFNVPSAEGVEF